MSAGEESGALQALRTWEEQTFRHGLVPGPLGSGEGPESEQAPAQSAPPEHVDEVDLGYLVGARLPDMPMRWDDRVVTYLEHFRGEARGRALMAAWLRRANRWDDAIRAALREERIPEDLRCVALAESGFDPTVRSPVGALGMWQFMPATGAEYGLAQSHWVDERMDPDRSTRAAARYLRDLHRRLGSWELALAAYNMGYGALLRAITKYNSNDYDVLSRIEAGLPFETTLYVAKILACAVVMRNPERFGFEELTRDPPLVTRTVEVPPGTALDEVARTAGVEARELASLNPHILRGRTPPGSTSYPLRLPERALATYTARASQRGGAQSTLGSALLRRGESLTELARRYRTSEAELRRMNELESDARVPPGTALLVPNVRPRAATPSGERLVVAVPATRFAYTDRRRVFYRLGEGETAQELARFFGVTLDELASWNHVDVRARLHAGMIVQLYLPRRFDFDRVVLLEERDVRVLVVGTDEFFDHHETSRGRVRVRYRVQTGDSLRSLSQRYGLTIGDLARINGIARDARLRVGSEILVYTSPDLAASMTRAPLVGEEPAQTATDTDEASSEPETPADAP